MSFFFIFKKFKCVIDKTDTVKACSMLLSSLCTLCIAWHDPVVSSSIPTVVTTGCVFVEGTLKVYSLQITSKKHSTVSRSHLAGIRPQNLLSSQLRERTLWPMAPILFHKSPQTTIILKCSHSAWLSHLSVFHSTAGVLGLLSSRTPPHP
jgi:hypothetical protein